MPKQTTAYEAFRPADRRRLRQALATVTRAREYRRVAAVLAVAEGESVTAVARQHRVDRTSVHRWVDRYLTTRAPAALADAPRGGRPRLRALARLTDRRLAAILARDPRTLGYRTTTWTVALLAAHCAQRWHCAVSPRTLRRRLHEQGFRWKRPRYVYSERASHLPQKKGLSAVA